MQFAPCSLDSALMVGSFTHFGHQSSIGSDGRSISNSVRYSTPDEEHNSRRQQRSAYSVSRRRRPTFSGASIMSSGPAERVEQRRRCSACLDEKSEDEVTTLLCEHTYCRDCLHRSVELVISGNADDNMPLYCCGSPIPFQRYETLLGGSLSVRGLRKLEDVITTHEATILLYCPRAECGRSIHLNAMMSQAKTVVCPDRSCKTKICISCRASEHKGTCKEDATFSNLIERNQWQSCPKCKRVVEKIAGCDEMVCPPPCNQQFCYRCGGPRRSIRPCHCVGRRRSKPPRRPHEADSVAQIVRSVAKVPCSWVANGIRRLHTTRRPTDTVTIPFEERARDERLGEARANEFLRTQRQRRETYEPDHVNRQRYRQHVQQHRLHCLHRLRHESDQEHPVSTHAVPPEEIEDNDAEDKRLRLREELVHHRQQHIYWLKHELDVLDKQIQHREEQVEHRKNCLGLGSKWNFNFSLSRTFSGRGSKSRSSRRSTSVRTHGSDKSGSRSMPVRQKSVRTVIAGARGLGDWSEEVVESGMDGETQGLLSRGVGCETSSDEGQKTTH